MDKIFLFYNQVFGKEYSNIEDIINDLKTIGVKSSNKYYKTFWSIKEIRPFSDNKKGLFMNSTTCGTWGGWLSEDRSLLLLENEEELKVKYLEHVMNSVSKHYREIVL